MQLCESLRKSYYTEIHKDFRRETQNILITILP